MCLLAILHRQLEGLPILLAANREESYTRPATGPSMFARAPRIVCGVDRRAGGTWLGLNEHGLIAAVTNRAKRARAAQRRSRGLLCLDLLRCRAAEQACAAAMRELASWRYDGCNVLCVDRRTAHVVHGGDALQAVLLEPGLHVLAAGDVDDAQCPRVQQARLRLERWEEARREGRDAGSPSPLRQAESWLEAAAEVCKQHRGPGGPAICLHGAGHGTVSSSLIALGEGADAVMYRHAAGPPCRTPYADHSHAARACLKH